MKHSRKKRTPQLDLDKLKEVGSQNQVRGELESLHHTFYFLKE